MSRLKNDELVLLDNLIYLDWDVDEDEELKDLIDNLLEDGELDRIINKTKNCLVSMCKSEWIKILKQIQNKPNLQDLKIIDLVNHKSGMRVACFVDSQDNCTVVFRGTATSKEWDDNGQGAYEYDTTEQKYALSYINSLNFDKIVVTGHSKGGNKAQYVTILSPKILNCVSVNGQGFSNEFINKYKDNIEKNKNKIVAINSKYDYVNCLFNGIAGEMHYIKTKFQVNPLFYHKANILLDDNGDLRQESNRGIFSKIINDFSTSIISDLPEDIRNLTIDGIISAIEFVLCHDKNNDKLIKIGGSILIMLTYGKYFKYKEAFAFSYIILQILMLPLLLWGDFIDIEETHSVELLNEVIKKISNAGDKIVNKINVIDNKFSPMSNTVSNAINTLINKLKAQEI